ncbi:hypothetical protein [Paenirhodobacter enshiensis]|uniref:hypothetical protein n=1 Tax=Paenirhodobacter enshiensis TaxID=1105367 RepID=UPI0035B41E12
MNDKTALEKLKDSVRQEVRQERTRGEDEARYEAANAVLVKAMKTGGGFADALTEFMGTADHNPIFHLIRKADTENRAALFEVIHAFHRFGLSPQIAEHLSGKNKETV